jgi:hypothetical protein
MDPNLKRMKAEILSSGLTMIDIKLSSNSQLGKFLEEYLKFSPLTGKKCAQALKRLAN